MPSYKLHPLTASVLLDDTPVEYTPARGPAMDFHLRYNQRAYSHADAIYGNAGAQWRYDWVSYVTDNNTEIVAPYIYTIVTLRGEGSEEYDGGTTIERTHWKSRARFQQVSFDPPRYERRLADGTVEVYAFPDRASSLPSRNIYLTQVIDPQGQALTFTYDAQIRLVAVTDALGQVTTLTYEDPVDPMLLTKVNDPFGRFATMTYNAAGQLASITDAIGMTSRFQYDASDFVLSMTTPYGTTTFKELDGGVIPDTYRAVEVTDPEGGRERIEYHITNPGVAVTVPAAEVPAGFSDLNDLMNKYLSFYWDKQAMAEAPGDLSRAVVTGWIIGSDDSYAHSQRARNIPRFVKRPLESRIWYRYPNQIQATSGTIGEQPAQVARLLDDGSTQLTQFTYNTLGLVTSRTDPLGRQTTYTYDTNGIDLLEARQTKPGGSDLLASYGGYTTEHQPTTVNDAAGQTTTTIYNAAGQPLTVTNAKNETTTYAYDATTGYLTSITGPVTGSTTTYSYDDLGRVRTITDSDGYTITTNYDALNRTTRRTYPDNTYEEFTYSRLDLAVERDRLGRLTRHFYDNVGHRTSTRDPIGGVTRQEWCGCGNLSAVVDPKGNRTAWTYDARGRVIIETKADESTRTLYTYDGAGRLKTVTDPIGQVATQVYLPDNSLSLRRYTNTVTVTPNIAYTYDASYRRVVTMTDGIGTTTYTYKDNGTLGAGQVASIDGPLTDDTITYTYDELGRLVSRAINGAANTLTRSFDALGRITHETNQLGTFTYTYDAQSHRLATVSYPNGQTSVYSYFPVSLNERLQTIHHKYPNGTTLSKFDYTYDSLGKILTWRQQADDVSVQWTYVYDDADQLTQATKWNAAQPPVSLQRYAYVYDPAGNRISEQIDDAITVSSYDSLNRLVTKAPGGGIRIAGTVSEAATVTIQGRPAVVDSTNAFHGTAATVPGTNIATIVAVDPSGNRTTQRYQFDQAGSQKTFTYDANGNVTSDGTRSFEWNARNQLTAAVTGSGRVEFKYDGLSRRRRQTTISSGQTTETAFVWDADDIVEQRDGNTNTTGQSFFDMGSMRNMSSEYYSTDHQASIRTVTDASGSLLDRFEYDPYGRTTDVMPQMDSARGFQGSFNVDDLVMTRYRAYDAELGRWLSSDPAEWLAGSNFYTFLDGNTTNNIDPDGLASSSCTAGAIKDVLSIPIPPYNKRVPLEKWHLANASELDSGPDPDERANDFVIPGSIVSCWWVRRMEQTQFWKTITLQEFHCTGNCGTHWIEDRFSVRTDVTRKIVMDSQEMQRFVPVIIDLLIEPQEVCQRYTQAPRY